MNRGDHMKKLRSTLLLLLAAIVLVFSGCLRVTVGGNPSETPGQKSLEPSTEPTIAPTVEPSIAPTEAPSTDMAVYFSTTALDGTTVTQDIFKEHKVNFVHYWATWCGPCTGELPELPELYEKYKDRVGFIAIVDSQGIESAQQILNDSKVTFLNVNYFPEITNIFGAIEYVPCTIIVNDRGEPMTEQIIGAVGIEKYAVYLDDALLKAENQ
jgi:thiol-disulfide isomerase/thioredoxin